MHGVSKYKVPGGKLIEVRADYDSVIRNAELLGDFFLYPEESISLLEKGLAGTGINETEEEIAKKLEKIIKSKKIEMIGIDPGAIAKAVRMAVGR